MELREFMLAGFPALSPDSTWEEAEDYFRRHRVAAAPVVEAGGMPVGVLPAGSLPESARRPGSIRGQVRADACGFAAADTDFIYLLRSGEQGLDRPLLLLDGDGRYAGIAFPEQILGAMSRVVQLYAGVLDSVTDGILAVDTGMRIVFVNQEFGRIHNVDHKRLLGQSVLEKFPETMLSTALNTNREIPYSNSRYFNHTGATVLASYRLMHDGAGEQIGSAAIVKDFSKTNELAINLREVKTMNSLFSSLFDALSEMVFALDGESRITYANQSAAAFFSIRAGETLDVGEIRAITGAILTDSQTLSRENEITVRDARGRTAYLVLSSIPLTDINHGLVGILCILKNVTSIKKLQGKVAASKDLLDFYGNQLVGKSLQEDLVCANPQFKKVLSTALHVAKLGVTVLIEGENGVGKDLVAKLIHSNSPRSKKPFIPVNCGAIPESLWESEMFGYEEGAFTGAKKGGKRGILELANGGTLFLDEVGSMPLSAQVKLLRVIQNMEITKLGMEEIKKIDLRIIAASNASLEQMVREGRFREDLYYRLNVIFLRIPPLRERPEEIVLLARRFIDDFNKKYGKGVRLTPEAAHLLELQAWPGNVRQLKNVVEYSVVMCQEELLPIHLPQHMFQDGRERQEAPGAENPFDIPGQVRALEISAMRQALEKTAGNKSEAIGLLNISRKTFYKKYREYGLDGEEESG